MVYGYWQIIDYNVVNGCSEGWMEVLVVGEVLEEVVWIVLQVVNLIGDGFYGVDIKQIVNCCCIIEINDNLSVDVGNEDNVLKDVFYCEVMVVFLCCFK